MIVGENMERCWKKVEELGSGSYGTVHLARSSVYTDADNPLAVKSADCSVPFAFESLKKEARVFRHLAGAPNVVHCFGEDVSQESDRLTYNLLLEYAPFGSLEELIQKEAPMPEWKVACYARMLLTGIHDIHSRGVVHCDLKSANILVFPGPSEDVMELKIADLGLAEWGNEWPYNYTPTWEGWGERYYNRGTATEASPESVLWGDIDKCGLHVPAADIWSIGCIVYEMMTGYSVWEWNGDMEYLYDQILNHEVQFPQNLSDKGLRFLKCCLDKDWSSRWSARQLLMHPFIDETSGINLTTQQPSANNMQPWSSTTHMFSEPATSCYSTNAAFGSSCQPQLLVV